jgi:hypothetical protein
MASKLEFPNPTRSFDEARNAVRFVGYENMVPIAFFVEVEALLKLGASSASEAECLAAFDASLKLMHDTARKAHSSGSSRPCTLTITDF